MEFYIFLCIFCYVVGIGAIALSFYVQRLEDRNRPKGYHLKATVQKITQMGDKRRLEFAFFLKGKPVTCAALASSEESRPVQKGRDYFIVYNDETGACVFNPCQKYRIWQAVLIIGGFFVAFFATLLTIEGFSLWF